MSANLPRHIVWSTDSIDHADPFQHRWWLRQVLTHGLAEDVRALDWDEVARELDALDLPREIDQLWRLYLESRNARK